MTTIDIVILVFALAMAASGWRRGVIVSGLSLVGFAAGALVGTRLAAALVSRGSASPYTPLFGLIGALLIGAVLSAALEMLGISVRRALTRVPGLDMVDGALGAVLGAALALGICWIAGSVALQTPGIHNLRVDVQRSSILRRLNNALPPSGALLHALARFDPFPSINGPDALVAAPPRGIGRVPAIQAAAASVVRVTGTACGLGIEGSGWVAGSGIVVTNAHVVAGEDDTSVQVQGTGAHLPAHAIAFDPRNDIAVLRVGQMSSGVRSLRLASNPLQAEPAAVLGFPHNGPYDVHPARLGPTTDVFADDAYGNGPLRRSIVSFRAVVRAGNSGGPVVDKHGHVIATVFATARDKGTRHTGYGVPNAVVRKVLDGSGRRVSTGPCAG